MTDITAPNYPMFRGEPVVRMYAIIKPFGPVCNLRCDYCFYLSKQDLLDTENQWRISDEILEEFIRQYIEVQNYQEVVFTWQGGEPTLLGLDFFRRVIELEKKYCPEWMRCENDLQTNGTLLDDEWCEFLKENNFLVGLSIDGPKDLHDRYRIDPDGNGSFDRVMNSVRLLKKHKVDFATLSCVNFETGKNPLKVYQFLRDVVGAKRMQFIPVVQRKSFRETAPQYWPLELMPEINSIKARPGLPDSVVEDWSVDPDEWGDFLCSIFDEWYKKDLGDIYVHYFEASVESWMGRINPLCTLAPMCGKGIALEHDGTIYSCDHYVYPEYSLGNIMRERIDSLAFSSRQERFATNKERMLPQYCRDCEYEFACFGECPKNRFIRTPDGATHLNYLCSGWKKFFSHIDKPIQKIVGELGYVPKHGRGISF
jgi:serine-type anaerobic sulfatase-maturating enzyme